MSDDGRLTKVCREKVVSLLSEFVNVDVFGKCGSLHCRRNNQDFCYGEMNKTYKFYLSFENSLCEVSVLDRRDALDTKLIFNLIYSGLCDGEVLQYIALQCDSCSL